MCEPIMIAAAGGLKAYGEYAKGATASKVAKRNAAYAEIQARDAIKRGEIEETNVWRQYDQIKGQQRAGFAANGVVIDQDSSADILEQTVAQGIEASKTAENNHLNQAFGKQVQANNFRAEASAAKFAGVTNAAATLLSTATKVKAASKS